jgi:hypothetical protein
VNSRTVKMVRFKINVNLVFKKHNVLKVAVEYLGAVVLLIKTYTKPKQHTQDTSN